ncbi:MmgE/PrpD family protein [Seohaeicola saemankumensis]|nr:MmgE/PrpD family protein [Seohaeicola saemankumensis]MCA0870540.1 MmgE/PrpD family protein [Seohaeicola saemankumensis]
MPDLLTLLLDLHDLPASQLPEPARDAARSSLYDWLICGRAGTNEPVADKLRRFIAAEGGQGLASVLGAGTAPARQAALVNGATSHAIDFDDTHFAHVGHLSVGIYPAALAVGEETGASAGDVVDAFLLGSEAAIRVGMALGSAHYNRGFHQTATAGAFGATLAAGRLIGLTRDQMRAAIGLCSTRASGLKSQFGTMGKPYNAGIAAANGVESARLAELGMSSCADGLAGPEGFLQTHTDDPGHDLPPVGRWLLPEISYKFHACCHGTHAMIEALRAVGPVDPGDVAAIELRTNPRWLSVCNIADPGTGLEVKFSYAWLAAMVLSGRDTSAFDSYSDVVAADPALAAIAGRMTVTGDAGLSDMQAEGVLRLASGGQTPFAHDISAPIATDVLRDRLAGKSRALLGPDGGPPATLVGDLATMTAADLGRMLRGEAA